MKNVLATSFSKAAAVRVLFCDFSTNIIIITKETNTTCVAGTFNFLTNSDDGPQC